jgi:hypothetical protein
MQIRDLATPDSRLFLKSEYGPLSDYWPALSFSLPQLKSWLNEHYRPASDFIVYTGTIGPATDVEYRARILSVLRIDLTRSYATQDVIPKASWERAQKDYPGQWKFAYKVLEGWGVEEPPRTSDVLPASYPKMGQFPHRGMALEIVGEEREALLGLEITKLSLQFRDSNDYARTLDAMRKDVLLNQEANRIADLIENRVAISGTVQTRTAPHRSAPSNLLFQVAELLREEPLTCSLCGGLMSIRPANKLLQPSPDRIDSGLGEYGPKNFQLSHLACNWAKNNATTEQFNEWLTLVRAVATPDLID